MCIAARRATSRILGGSETSAPLAETQCDLVPPKTDCVMKKYEKYGQSKTEQSQRAIRGASSLLVVAT